jgi:hypothetical protein
VRNTQTRTLASDAQFGLLMDDAGIAHIIAAENTGNIFISRLDPDGTNTAAANLPGSSGQGFEMHAAAGSDGLHALFLNRATHTDRHFRGTNNGVTWTAQPPPVDAMCFDLDLAGNSLGEVYASCNFAGTAILKYWDGTAWIGQQSFPTAIGYRSDISDEPYSPLIRWAAYQNASDTLQFCSGSQPGGVMASGGATPGHGPIWDMSASSALGGLVYAAGGGPNAAQSAIDLYTWGATVYYQVAFQNQGNDHPDTWGRTLANGAWEDYYGDPHICLFAAHEGSYKTLRSDLVGGTFQSTMRPWTLQQEDYELRHTASATYNWGGSLAGLMCNFIGSEAYMEWSSFGDWEDLPLPAALRPENGAHISCPELFTGRDGRWHIIYHDLDTDEVRCVSTL